MCRIYLIIFYFFLISSNFIYSQDKIAKTAKGQIVILKKDGTWKLKKNIGLYENTATTEDGQFVLLGSNGKWFLSNSNSSTSSKIQESNQHIENEYSSLTGTLTIPYSSAAATGNASVHVPVSIRKDLAKTRPLMMLLDPGGNAKAIVARWQAASEHYGWIIASTPAIMNGTDSSQIMKHLLAMWNAVAAKWSVDRQAVMLEGFSGGGCAAYRQVLMHPDLFRGAIVECGHMGPFLDLQDRIRPGSIFFLATRTNDFNAQHMRDLAQALKERGEMVKFIELSGGHESLIGSETDNALEWVSSHFK